MDDLHSRRNFLKQSALAAAALPLLPTTFAEAGIMADGALPDIHIFSKHLQFLSYADMAAVAAEMGFKGIDLTIRPQGHVLPERVEADLPKAVEAMKKVGLAPQLMTTAVDDASDATSVRLLKTAAGLGFRTYRMAWYQYDANRSLPESIDQYRQQMQALGQLNKTLGLVGCYQNHAGQLVGASVWELWEMLRTADPQHMGIQYDIRHATVEGGLSWPNGLRLLQPRIKTLVLKDFRWEKKDGKWVVQNTPIGEGMVDFKTYFGLLKKYNLRVPISLHVEYPLGGAEEGATRLSGSPERVFAAMKQDLARIRELWQVA
ncbi:sugar phosphate isomerase/epimerase [Spirosoma taeanense]|uniref:Sugar phosphate isomerase/epimerase n=1 Tax=Spirosoma taeanense TaxID=2735870 RepID=A0A6M5Y7T5_9BACT|nr:sugar phosphate isomerase/epimerase family protein [Spirosoma taeanense]QJW89321.1 sugar phosphate isomerase/epimerase [Spirosoma taeanense]